MPHARTGPLSQAAIGFWILVDSLAQSSGGCSELSIPDEVEKLALAIRSAALLPRPGERRDYQPKVRLNRSSAALRREHPTLFREVHRWLQRPEVRELFARKGHSPTWHLWVEAAAKIAEGLRSTGALVRTGRPHEMRFSPYHDAALYAEYLCRVEGVTSEKATTRAARLREPSLDRRGIERWRQQVRRVKVSKLDLKEQYQVIARKYRLRLPEKTPRM